jgi:hypothetical protein
MSKPERYEVLGIPSFFKIIKLCFKIGWRRAVLHLDCLGKYKNIDEAFDHCDKLEKETGWKHYVYDNKNNEIL